MRHNKKFNHLGRKAAHRRSLLANMTISLIMEKRIFTTLAKAKALRMYAEPLINRAKEDTTPNRRLVFSHLQNKYAVTELFNEIATKIGDRPGGYTRILKTGNRLGDNAQMCFIELVDYSTYTPGDDKKTKKTRRSRRSKSAASVAETPAETAAPEAAAPAEEAPAAELELPAAEPEKAAE